MRRQINISQMLSCIIPRSGDAAFEKGWVLERTQIPSAWSAVQIS